MKKLRGNEGSRETGRELEGLSKILLDHCCFEFRENDGGGGVDVVVMVTANNNEVTVVSVLGIVTCIGIYLVRCYVKGAQFVERVKANGKVALVTGASAGIGKQTVRELNLRGATVYMLCRDWKRAHNAKIALTKVGCDPTRLILKDVDLANFATIRKFADEMEKGHFLLTELLLPLIKKSPNGRIVNVSSSLHKRADTVDFSIVNDRKHFSKSLPYSRSKLAQVMHARELTRRLRAMDPQTTVTINVVHPGVCFTELMRYTIFNSKYILPLITPILWLFMKTDKDGAQTTLFLALSESVGTISGRYFGLVFHLLDLLGQSFDMWDIELRYRLPSFTAG